MPSKITLLPVNYYSDNDIYTTEVDNRPLRDLSANIGILADKISNFGFYQEKKANPETEPPGGFSPYTCAYVAENGLLYPIDISTSVVTIDYAKYPILLVISKLSDYTYECISASTSLEVSELFNKFLPDSVGKAVKIGPGGTLIDEIYFDLYFSSYNYQNIIVGKVMTPTSISFGGNQLNVLGNNRFLSKNKKDSSTGVITFIRDTSDTLVTQATVLYDTLGVPYRFTEYQAYSLLGTSSNDRLGLPVYFSNTDLLLDAKSGTFSSANLESLLNEVHFKSVSISAGIEEDAKYLTSGVNIKSLLSYASDYLVHSKPLSVSLSEVSQTISTSLLFDNDVTTKTYLKFNSTSGNHGTILDSTNSYPTSLLTISSDNEKGVLFGEYAAGQLGACITYVNDLSTGSVTDNASGIKMSEMQSGYSLLLHSKNTISSSLGAGNIFLVADGYLSLAARGGVFCSTVPASDFEITNKKYVDTAIGAILDSAASKIPLDGTDSSSPVLGQLYFDIKSNVDPSTVFFFDTLNVTKIKSTNRIDFVQAGGAPQIVTAATPITGALGTQLATVDFVNSAVAGVIPSGTYVHLLGTETIDGAKTFTQPVVIENNNPLDLIISSGTTATINTNAAIVHFPAKLTTNSTITSDAATTLTTKDYVDTSIANSNIKSAARYYYGYSTANNTNGFVSVTNTNATFTLNNSNFIATGANGIVYTGTSPVDVKVKWSFNVAGVQLKFKGSFNAKLTMLDELDNILDEASIFFTADQTNVIYDNYVAVETFMTMTSSKAVKFKLYMQNGNVAAPGSYKQVITLETI